MGEHKFTPRLVIFRLVARVATSFDLVLYVATINMLSYSISPNHTGEHNFRPRLVIFRPVVGANVKFDLILYTSTVIMSSFVRPHDPATLMATVRARQRLPP